jgi:broad-specificity NMP kinase
MSLNTIRSHVRRILKTSWDVAEKLPKKDDSKLGAFAKLLSIGDIALTYFHGDVDAVQHYLSQYPNLVSKINKQFVTLFFSIILREDFQVSIQSVDEDRKVVKVVVPDNGTLFFSESNNYNGKMEKGNEFWYSAGFDFKKLLNHVWEKYDGRIYASLEPDSWRSNAESTFVKYPPAQDKVYGGAQGLLKEKIKRDLGYRIGGVHRTYLFVGEPGTGKSSFAQHMTSKSDRVIKFEAKSLDNVKADTVTFLLDGLEPEYIIIDDIDRVVAFSSSLSVLLTILETIKATHPDTVLILTANDTSIIDKALLRPGRIDEIIEFEPQNAEEREHILIGYIEKFKLDIKPKHIKKVIKSTDGLTAAFMREIAIQLKYSTIDEVLDTIQTMRKFILTDEPKKADKKKKRKKKKKKIKINPFEA